VARHGRADIPTTWDQLLDVATRLTTPDRFGVSFETTPGYYQNFTWYPFMWMGAPDVEVFDVDAAAAALGLWKGLVDSGAAPRELLGGGGSDAAANLGSGFCAMQQTGIWSIAQLRDMDPDFRYGLFPLPTPEGGTYTTDLGGWSFVANAKGANPEAAGQFIAYALGSMSEGSIARGISWATEAKTGIPPRASVLEEAQANGAYADGPLAVFADQIAPGGRSEPRFPPEVYRPISDAIQAAQLGGTDPMSAAERAAEQIDGFLQTYDGAPIL
jgi:multiple sugar transport system substrate-binding protein